MSKKPIIVFEGIEGSGKSHHINKIANYLKKEKKNFIKIREPGGSKNSEKKIILIDRCVDSTFAYQHYGMGVDINLIKSINNYLIKDINIHFTFLNLVTLNNMKKRLLKRKKLNRYDQFSSSFYKKVQDGFIKILKKNPKRYLAINSNLNIDDNENIILNKFKKLI